MARHQSGGTREEIRSPFTDQRQEAYRSIEPRRYFPDASADPTEARNVQTRACGDKGQFFRIPLAVFCGCVAQSMTCPASETLPG